MEDQNLTTQTYSYDDFVKDVTSMKPRFADIWVVPPLVMFAAWKAKSLGKWTRRALFSAGVYMIYRNWTSYQQFVQSTAQLAKSAVPPAADQVSTVAQAEPYMPQITDPSLNGDY